MPIEFLCPSCHAKLRVPDGSFGKKAACPKCQAINLIPEVSTPTHNESISSPLSNHDLFGASGGFPPQETSWQANFEESDNPFQTPADFGREDIPRPIYSGDIVPTKLRFEETFSETYRVFTRNIGSYILIGLLLIAAYAPWQIFNLIAQFNPDFAETPEFLVIACSLWIVTTVFGTVIFCGVVSFMLNLIRTGQSSASAFWKGTRKFFPILGYGILFSLLSLIPMVLIIMVGALLVSIIVMAVGGMGGAIGGGIVLAFFIIFAMVFTLVWTYAVMIRFGWGLFTIIDKNAGVFESFKLSWQITRRNTAIILATFILHGILLVLITVMTLSLGGIVTLPYLYCLMTVCYLLMTGQHPSKHAGRELTEW